MSTPSKKTRATWKRDPSYVGSRGRLSAALTERVKPKVIRSLLVRGREWHRRSVGGMFHTAEIILNGRSIGKTPEMGGTDFLTQAAEWLETHKYIQRKRHPNGSAEPLREVAKRMGFEFGSEMLPVKREKDL